MPKQRVLAGLAVVLAVVAIVVVRSTGSKPERPEATVQPEAADTSRADGDEHQSDDHKGKHSGKSKKGSKKGSKKSKVKHNHHIDERKVVLGADKLSCPECNVVVISVDSLRADHMSAYGYERATTPYFDKLAKTSVVFDNAISQATWTAPAIASMLTGQLPREHGMLFHPNPGSLAPTVDTLASRLAKAGYQTASWNGGGYVTKSMGKGFEVWRSASRTFKTNLESARNWLLGHGSQRFFVFLQAYDLQKPYLHSELNTFYQPKGTYDMMTYCKRGDDRVLEGDELDYVTAQYDAGLVAVDKEIGKFLNFLRDKKLFANTIVILTAAHGEELFEHGKCDHKQSVYSELVHVPLIIHLPTKLTQRVSAPVGASVGIKPTVLGMLGLDQGPEAKRDLRLAIRGKGPQPAVLSETGTLAKIEDGAAADANAPKLNYYKASVTTPDFKLVYDREGDKDRWELYDVKAKPPEKADLSASNAARLPKLKALLFPPRGAPVIPALPQADNPVAKPATSN